MKGLRIGLGRGAHLAASGESVSVIARGAQLEAIRERGLIVLAGDARIEARYGVPAIRRSSGRRTSSLARNRPAAPGDRRAARTRRRAIAGAVDIRAPRVETIATLLRLKATNVSRPIPSARGC